MLVRSILQSKGSRVVATRPEASVGETARLMAENNIGAVLVLDEGGAVAGIISERDIVRDLARHGRSAPDRPVADLMTRTVLHCAPDATIDEVMAVMTEKRVRHLPVIEDGRLVGLVSIGDVVKWRLEETRQEAEALRDYVLAGR
jgi:CBS domain-containing protein